MVVVENVTEQKKADYELRKAEERFRALFEQSGGYCMILDPNTPDGIPIIIDANEAASKVHGYTREEFIGRPVADIDDEDGKRQVKQRTAEIMKGKPFYVENTHERKDGTSFSVAVNAKRIDIGDEPPLIFTTEYDITKRIENELKIENKTRELEKHFEKSEKQRVANLVILSDLNRTTSSLKMEIKEREKAEEQIKKDLLEKNTLLQELYHRTKNNMQVISSMLKMEARRSNNKDLQTSFKEITGKINTMALVHQKLYQAKDLSRINLKEYIVDLIQLITRSYSTQARNVSFQYDLEDIFVLIDTVMPLGLVLNELISNVFKHAFPDNAKGILKIVLKLGSENAILLSLKDNGIGIPDDLELRESKSMGLQTMFSLIEHQLLGSVEYEVENGLIWKIKLKDTINRERV